MWLVAICQLLGGSLLFFLCLSKKAHLLIQWPEKGLRSEWVTCNPVFICGGTGESVQDFTSECGRIGGAMANGTT